MKAITNNKRDINLTSMKNRRAAPRERTEESKRRKFPIFDWEKAKKKEKVPITKTNQNASKYKAQTKEKPILIFTNISGLILSPWAQNIP